MVLKHLKKSLRLKLLLPISLLLVISFAGIGTAIVKIQQTLLADMGRQLNTTLAASDAELKIEFEQLDADLKSTMTAMTANATSAITEKTRQAFNSESRRAQAEGTEVLADKVGALAELLAQVAPQAILFSRTGDLVKFAKSAQANADVIYAIFLRPDGRPYTPLMNIRAPRMQGFIKQGSGENNIAKVIDGSKKDPTVLVLEKSILQEGQTLGKVVLGASRGGVASRNAALAERLTKIVEANQHDIQMVLETESKQVAARLDRSVATIAGKNKAVIDKTGNTLSKVGKAAGRRTRQAIFLVGAVSAAVLVLGVAVLIMILMIKPLERVVENLKVMAQGEGDLTTRLPVKSKDEMGLLAHWFNIFMEKLQAILREVAGKSEAVSHSSEMLLQLSGQMSSGTRQVSGKADSVSTAARQMSSNLNSVAAATQQATSNVNMVSGTVEEMSATIGEISENTEKARTVVASAVNQSRMATRQVESLGQAATQISKVTEVITEISEQTNLLALNATIEAARAGEAGKGFAVVANEIKELAGQTSSATHDIKTKISEIQDSTARTVADISKTSQEIEGVSDIVSTIATSVEEQSMATREIAGNLSQATSGIDQINTSIASSNQVAAGMADEVETVTQVTEKISGSSARVSAKADELAPLAAELKALIGGFTL